MIESEEHKSNLIKLATEKLKFKAQSYPKDENGIPTEPYLEYISNMYDAEVIKIVLQLDVFPKMTSLRKLAKKIGVTKEELMKKLESSIDRGFLVSMGEFIGLPTPLFIHDIPFILEENYSKENIKEFADLSRQYFEEGYYKTWETSRKGVPRMRVLTVEEAIEDTKQILPVDRVYEIIKQHKKFAVVPCPCRKRREIEGSRQCTDKYPIMSCIMMGPFAETVVSMNDPVIKEVSMEEVIELTKKASELGLVHATDNDGKHTAILCACCECCCGMLAGLTRLDNPRAIAKANYISNIDIDSCIACGTCITRCKFGAIKVDNYAIVEEQKCLGCGLCSVTCPSNAISMVRLEREVIPNS